MAKNRKRKLDRYEGLSKVSLIEDRYQCYLCGESRTDVEHHHIFGGPNRESSDKLGLVVMLCPDCHRTGKYAVHKDVGRGIELKVKGQTEFEKFNSHEDFVRIFHRNWI